MRGARGGYSPGRSPSRSRSRSRSPPSRRYAPSRPNGPRSPPAQRRETRRDYSDYSEGEYSEGEYKDRRPAPTGIPAPPLPGAFKKEIMQLKSRESELKSRITTIEEAYQQEKASRETFEAKAQFLTEKFKSVAERSKNRGTMLMRIVAALKGVEDARTELKQSEEVLANVMQEATAMMREEQGGGAAAAPEPRDMRDEQPPVSHPPVSHPQRGESSPTYDRQEPPPQAPSGEGGNWTEGTYADAGGHPNSKHFKPFTFKIKL